MVIGYVCSQENIEFLKGVSGLKQHLPDNYNAWTKSLPCLPIFEREE